MTKLKKISAKALFVKGITLQTTKATMLVKTSEPSFRQNYNRRPQLAEGNTQRQQNAYKTVTTTTLHENKTYE